MKFYKSIITVLVYLSFCGVLLPQSVTKTGTTASQFLKIGVGPRAIGMGSAFTATADDISALYWNPGGLAFSNSNQAFFNHVRWIADINYDFAAFSSNVPGFGTVGTFVSVLSTDDMKVRTIEKPEGTGEIFNYGTLAVGLCYARQLTEQFSIGLNVKYINEKLWNMSSNGFAVDIGTMYKIPILNEFRIAASISNFGTKMKLEGRDILSVKQVGSTGSGNLINTDIQLDSYDLPLLFRVGLAADVVKSNSNRITLAADAIHPNDHTEYINTGMEYSWNEIIFLRGGYSSLFERDTEKGLTAGVGLNYRIVDLIEVKIDYAYEGFGRLKNVQYFSLGVKF
ncbi:MAG: PorV/PorQ family protein [Ignavibacteriales bacterium]|nr:PorV/PorQ family protein [Ignavibacteriales bacterium]